ncbi:protein DpdG [Streptomyces sp. NRRL S-481]|uniref:protein DpdG n=1 Tax=Streptomyces sp. NRRL S-481 TaxID=1463911 RepID=UPI0004C9A6D2|nr:protein DpdG [Streptomyces sp. NRRL S-481]
MVLINVDASRPDPMWAVVRLLAHSKKPVALNGARALLSPPTLASGDKDASEMFNKAVKTLRELGLLHVAESTGELTLMGPAEHLDGQDWDAFAAALRSAVFAPERNSGLGDNDEQRESRDLTRALAWLLTLDPMGPAVGWDQAQDLMKETPLKPEAGPAVVNAERWRPFCDWASALGLAARPLLSGGAGSRLVPDCTAAVRYVMQSLWEPGRQVNAVTAVRSVREYLPVLAGGQYSLTLHLPNPGDRVAGPALSFALLRGHDEGWLRLELDSDAALVLQVTDPEQPSSPRYVSDLTMQEAPSA